MDKSKYLNLTNKTYYKKMGKVTKVVGLTIESVGPDARLNDLCHIMLKDEPGKYINAEVVGFKEKRIILMPFENVDGIGPGCIVENTNRTLSVKVGDELLGKTLDGLGNPMDGTVVTRGKEYPVDTPPPDPMSCKIIDEILPLGVKAVDGLLTIGKDKELEFLQVQVLVKVH